MRVIAGEARSLRLVYPRGVDIRPTTDAMRESLFASLADLIEGASFADLYAGAGSVGIEALSRGASKCVFLEKAPRCLKAIAVNLENTRLEAEATIIAGPAEKRWGAAAAAHGPFDIVFADPPYGAASFTALAERLVCDREGVAQEGLVVIQCR
jgi:16S rRNA (guanine(966)-N(2))-methyltransferase RsmD